MERSSSPWSVWKRFLLSASTLLIRVPAMCTSPTTLPCTRSAVSLWRMIADWPESLLCCCVPVWLTLFYSAPSHKICLNSLTNTNKFMRFTGESYEVRVRYILNHHGYFPATMYFEFCPDLKGATPFCIVREMEAVARTPLGVELGPVSPYKARKIQAKKPLRTVIVEGEPPER